MPPGVLRLFCLSLFAQGPVLMGQGPVLKRLNFPGTTAELGASPVSLPFELEFTAPGKLAYVEMKLTSSSGDSFEDYFSLFGLNSQVSGTLQEGTFRFTLSIPAFRKADDTWTISAWMRDDSGEITDYPVMPAGSTPFLATTNSGVVDQTPPVLRSVTLAPETVDITSGAQTVTFTATAEDDIGIEDLQVDLSDPDGRYLMGGYLKAAKLIAGTAQSGTWQGTLSVPAFGPPGTYQVAYYVKDGSQRGSYHSSVWDPSPAIRTTLAVTTTGPVDSAPPVLTSISSTRQEVDVTEGPQTVRVDLSAVDAPAGINYISVSLTKPEGYGSSQYAYLDLEPPYLTQPVSGSLEFMVPRYSPPGLYTWWVHMADGAAFESVYGLGELSFPEDFSGTLLVVNKGPYRGTPPVATSFSITPSSLPEAGLPGLLEYTVQATDPAAITHMNGRLVKPNGIGEEFPMKRIAGTPKSGTWQGKVRIGKNKGPGDYRTGFQILDETGDEAYYGAYSYGALPYQAGWPVSFTITPGGAPLSAYQTWRLGHSGFANGGGGESEDPDGDGWPNALEFLCGMDPFSSSPLAFDDPHDTTPRILWNPWGYRMEYYLDNLNMLMGSGTNLKAKGWKSATAAPGSWQSLPPRTLGSSLRYLQLDSPSSARPRQFLRMTVEP